MAQQQIFVYFTFEVIGKWLLFHDFDKQVESWVTYLIIFDIFPLKETSSTTLLKFNIAPEKLPSQ